MRRAFAFLPALALAVAAIGTYVLGSDGSVERTPSAADEERRVTIPSGGLVRPLKSLEAASETTVVATPVREWTEFWVPMVPEQGVWSRWVFRVDEVLEGDVKPGDEIIVGLPGGRMNLDANLSIATGRLEGSMRPKPEDPVTLVEFSEFPRFELGRAELLLLIPYPKTDGWEDADFWTVAGPEGRYVLEPDGSLTSPLGAVLPELPVRKELELMSLNQVATTRVR